MNMSDTRIAIKAWNANTPNEMGGFVAKQIRTAKRVDILTGYFFFDGFESIQKELGENPNVTLRILVGMDAGVDTSGLIHEVYKHEKSHAGDDDAIREEYLEQLQQVLRKWPTEQLTKYQSDAWKQYAGMIEKGHLQIRKTRRPNHSKVYIFHKENGEITYTGGSSNFSYSGLCSRNEFNIHVTRAHAKEVAEIFDKLWETAVPIADFKTPSETSEVVKTLRKKTPDSAVKPFDAYMKVLYEYMNLQKTDDKLDVRIRKILRDAQFPDGQKVKEHNYQINTIQRAQNILDVQGGVIVADVVGLGKSIVASVLASLSDAPGIIIAPRALCGEGNWETYLSTFHLQQDGWRCFSYGMIDSIPQEIIKKARTIIIDEAHNIRNKKTEAYQKLSNICKGKKLVFLSATPFNNKPDDILALISLISNNTIAGFSKTELETMFSDFSKRYREIRNETDPAQRKEMAEALSVDIRKVVSRITVRRNRLDLIGEDSPYREEMLPLIPEIAAPDKKEFELTPDVGEFYEKILTEYFAGKDKAFQGFMYTPELCNGGKSDTEAQLFSMICHFVVARLESSPTAFRKTVENIKRTLDASISLFENEGVFLRLSPDFDIDDLVSDENFSSAIEKEWETAIKKYKHTIYVRTEERRNELSGQFGHDLDGKTITVLAKPDEFLDGLRNDSAALEGILVEFNRMKLGDPEKDAKFQCLAQSLREVLNGKKYPSAKDGKPRKAIVFSGFADTAEYVAKALDAMTEFKGKIMFVSGGAVNQKSAKTQDAVPGGPIGHKLTKAEARDFCFSEKEYNTKAAKEPLTMRDAVIRNFKHSALQENSSPARKMILVCTDVLSEGIDLNAAGIVFNYDMAYNPVRIIQRLGRINRIATKVFDTLYRVNFFPTPNGEKINNIKTISTMKAHVIQALFAEDASILADDESVQQAGNIFSPEADPANGPMSEDLQIRGMFKDALKLKCGTPDEKNEKCQDYLAKIKKLPGRFCKFHGREETLIFFLKSLVSISAIELPRFASQKDADTINVSLVEALKKIQCEPDRESISFQPSETDPVWAAFSTWEQKKFHVSSVKQNQTKFKQACGIIQNMDFGPLKGEIIKALSKNPDFAKAVIGGEHTEQVVLRLFQTYNQTQAREAMECFMTCGILQQKGNIP